MTQAVEDEVFDAGVLESSIPCLFGVDFSEGCFAGENKRFCRIAIIK